MLSTIYEYEGYTFIIDKKDNLYTARSGTMYTYDESYEGLKKKIETVVYQNKDFKLSVDPLPELPKSENQQIIDRVKQDKKERIERFNNRNQE